MKGLKKGVAAFTAAIMLAIVGSCAGGGTSSGTSLKTSEKESESEEESVIYSADLPVYDDCEEVFFIGAFGEPRRLVAETFQDAADLGITHMYIDPWFNGADWNRPELLKKAVELCDDAGMKAILLMPAKEEHKSTYSWKDFETNIIANGGGEYDETFRLSDWRGFGGIIYDEPFSNLFPFFKEDYADYKVKYPDSEYIINMLAGDSTYANQEEYYDVYLDQVLMDIEEDKRIFSIDSYPLTYSNKENVVKIANLHITHTELASHYAKQSNSKFYAYIATLGYGWGAHRIPSTVDDIRWQVGSNLVFGAKGIELFTYSEFSNDGFESSVVKADGSHTEIYDFCKTVFDELHAFEKVYLSFDYVGTFAYDSDAKSANPNDVNNLAYALNGHRRIKNYSAERDLLIGAFKDKNGYDGFMFNSYTEPYYRKYNKIHVEFNEASRALYYINGERKLVELSNGVFEYEMSAGDILFVIPIK